MSASGEGPEAKDWQREARRLRFSDGDWEQRFRREWVLEGVTRSRIMLVVAILMTVAMGLVDVNGNVSIHPEFVWLSMWQRVGVAAPIWLGLWLAPSLPHYEKLAPWIYPVGTTLVVWGVAFIPWMFQLINPEMNVQPLVLINCLGISMISVFALPMFLRGTLMMLVASAVGIVALFHFTVWSENVTNSVTLAGGLVGFSAIVSILAWNRESGGRRDFGQREIVANLNRELARMNAEKNEFMAAAAHDLRAPLAAVQGLAGQMGSGRMEDPERRAKAVSAIDDLSGRMLEVVNNYLGEHALESGTLPVRLEQVELREVLVAAAQRHGPSAQAKDQRVDVLAGPNVRVQTDAALLSQVLDNFISNALKFSPPGATVRLALAEAAAVERVRLEVIDAGPGVSEADCGKLFRKYGQASARPTAGESSHGIGLAVAKRVAEAMGGEVGCDSKAGAGAVFWVSLPMR